MKYDILLWDIDDTLLDFPYSEQYAIRHCFSQMGYPVTDFWVKRYGEINLSYWKRLEKGEVSKGELLRGRFADLFGEMGLQGGDPDGFQKLYERALGSVFKFRDEADRLCTKLKKYCRQYLVTNGVEVTQKSKWEISGLNRIMDGIFISEPVGFVKPRKEFFDVCFSRIPDFSKERALLIGDSLSSDIKGANNAGIVSCWYNPEGKAPEDEARPDYEIRNLWEVEQIIGIKN